MIMYYFLHLSYFAGGVYQCYHTRHRILGKDSELLQNICFKIKFHLTNDFIGNQYFLISLVFYLWPFWFLRNYSQSLYRIKEVMETSGKAILRPKSVFEKLGSLYVYNFSFHSTYWFILVVFSWPASKFLF